MTDETIEPRDATKYWPTVEANDLGSQIRSRYIEYQAELERRGLIALWQQVQETYDGYDAGTGSFASWVTEGGEEGEFLHLHVNEFASLIRHQLTLTTSEPLTFDAIAANDSPEAEAQASLGKQAIRNYQRDPYQLDALLVDSAERMLLFGAGYVVQLWDVYEGPEVLQQDGPAEMGPESVPAGPPISTSPDGAPMQIENGADGAPSAAPQYPEPTIRAAGDFTHKVYSPIDIARDLGCRSHRDCDYYIVRERWNKYELAARYPEHADHIVSQPAYDADDLSKHERSKHIAPKAQTDQVHALRLLHARTTVMPEGMEAFVVGSRVIGPILPLAYKRLPVHVMMPQEAKDTAIPRALNWDLLGPQAALNAAWSNGLTSSDAGSVPKYAVARDAGVDVKRLSPNMTAVYYDAKPQLPDAGIPRLMDVPEFKAAHVAQIDACRQTMERLSNVNAVARGESEGKSGADNALLAAQTQQNLSSYRLALVTCAKSVGLGIIEGLQSFATDERMIRVFGEDETWSVSYFKSDDLSDVSDVEVEMGDPLTRTLAGRKEMIDMLSERWPDQFTPQSVIAAVATGRFEPLYKAQRNSIRLIRAENQKLMKGEVQPVVKTDCHADHIREHLALLSSPAIRADDTIVSTVLSHVGEHSFLWTMMAATEPNLLAATGQQPPPMPAMPGAPAGPGGPPGGPEAPSDGPGSAGAGPQQRANVGGRTEGPGGVPLPAAPKNAGTGQPAPMPAGPGGVA